MRSLRSRIIKSIPVIWLGLSFTVWFFWGLPEAVEQDRMQQANPEKCMFFGASVKHNMINNFYAGIFGVEIEIFDAAYLYWTLKCHW